MLTSNPMERTKITGMQEKAARYAKAMGHPVRIYILELLAGQRCCYSGDLADELPVARSTLSQHLKALRDAGLIQGEIEPPKIKYCLNQAAWEEAKSLLEGVFDRSGRFKKVSC